MLKLVKQGAQPEDAMKQTAKELISQGSDSNSMPMISAGQKMLGEWSDYAKKLRR
jgi:hypothetical protein